MILKVNKKITRKINAKNVAKTTSTEQASGDPMRHAADTTAHLARRGGARISRVLLSTLVATAGLATIGVGAGAPAAGAAISTQAAGDATSTSRSTAGARDSYDQLAPAKLPASLQVVSILPSGMLRSVEQASEIRVQFDRPVVSLGAVDDQNSSTQIDSMLTITPPLPGVARWASTRVLIYTVDVFPAQGAKYSVTVNGVKGSDGSALSAPKTTTFETPVPKCVPIGELRRDATSIAMQCPTAVALSVLQSKLQLEVKPRVFGISDFRPIGTVGSSPALSKILTSLEQDAKTPRRNAPVTLSIGSDNQDGCPEFRFGVHCVIGTFAAIPKDRTATVKVAAGVTTEGGNVLGSAYTVGTFETPITPLLANNGCADKCNPDQVIAIATSGARFDADGLNGQLKVTNLSTNRTSTYRFPSSTSIDDLPYEMTDPLSLRWAKLQPRTAYKITIGPDAFDSTGQSLNYEFATQIGFGARPAGFDGPTGEKVLEAKAPSLVAYQVRNLETIQRVVAKLEGEQIVEVATQVAGGPGIKRLDPTTVAKARTVRLGKRNDADRLTAIRLGDDSETGVYLVAVREGKREPGTTYDENGNLLPDNVTTTSADTTVVDDSGETRALRSNGWQVSLVQHTDLGVSIRRSPGNVLVAVTSINGGTAVKGAKVEVRAGGKKMWSGTTDDAGLAWVDNKALSTCPRCDLFALVSAGSDSAYAQSRWREWGVESPSEYRTASTTPPVDTSADGVAEEGTTGSETTQARPQIKIPDLPPGQRFITALFADRGVYRLGEEVKLKGVVRVDTGRGLEMPKGLKELRVDVTDGNATEISVQTVKVSDLGSFDMTVTIPTGGRQGSYSASVVGVDGYASWLVTSFRNPDFKVDISLDQRAYVPGQTVVANTSGRYLFGAPMENAPLTWTLNPGYTYFNPVANRPELKLDAFRFDYICVTYDNCDATLNDRIASSETDTLDADGRLVTKSLVPVITKRHRAVDLTFEAEVSDVNRQAIAGRTNAILHPGEHYVGVALDKSFISKGSKLSGKAVAVGLDGTPKAGVAMTARLVQWEYVTAKRQSSDSTVTTEGRWQPRTIGETALTSATTPVPFSLTPTKTGYYEVQVFSTDQRGNWVEASTDAYVTGEGYVSWETPDGSEGTLGLVLERSSARVGQTARILVQSPWETAEALVTTEGRVVYDAKRVPIRGSAAVIDVPITDEHVPNVIVSVTLYKGRTNVPGQDIGVRADDPGRPAIRTATVSIDVPTTERELDVAVSVPKAEERPGVDTSATVKVLDASGKPASGEVTLWAVDEGVLRLTGFQTPDLISTLYQRRYDSTEFSDSRMLLLDPVSVARLKMEQAKGDEAPAFSAAPGGGGGEGAAGADVAGAVRSDFRTLAAWSASARVGDDGQAVVPIDLPENLTEFRIIAVAASGAGRFGGATTSVRTSKPFAVVAALPRFVNLGDEVEGGVVVQNRTKAPGTVKIRAQISGASAGSKNPLALSGADTITRQVPVGATEVRFAFNGAAIGTANLKFTAEFTPVTGAVERDGVEVKLPVTITRRAEVVATAGTTSARKSTSGASASEGVERLSVPTNIEPGFGGLEIVTSSSALAGLQAGITNLVEYPYGCLEQRTSRLKVLMALKALGDQYSIAALPKAKMDAVIRTELDGLRNFQTYEGGLSYWPGDDRADVYLTSRTLVLLLDAKDQGLAIPAGLTNDLTRFLQEQMANVERDSSTIDSTEGESDDARLARLGSSLWWNRAEALFALARAGAPEAGVVKSLYRKRTELSQREQLALLRAMLEAGVTGEMPQTLYTEIRNGLRMEADRASLDGERYSEVPCWCNAYLYADDTHLTAELLKIVVRADADDPLAGKLARELLARRNNGTWMNTHEDGYALTALVDYAKIAENVSPDLTLAVSAGTASVVNQRWNGRSLKTETVKVGFDKLPSGEVPLTFAATGSGKVSYAARLTYAKPLSSLKALDRGFSVVRSYTPYRRDITAGSATSSSSTPSTTVRPINGRSSAVRNGDGTGTVTFKPGDLVRVTISVSTAQTRTNVVIDDPLPAGFEAVDSQLESTTRDQEGTDGQGFGESGTGTWYAGIDRSEIRDDRVLLFATRLTPGELRYTYLARATAPGRFSAPPTQVEEMYRPELFGRTATQTVIVAR
jgi:alpha-2-macroglobulin